MLDLLLYKITYSITLIEGVFILIFIFVRHSKARFNIFYGLLNISLVIWAMGRLALLVVDNYELALIWGRILHIGSIWVHIFFLHTVLIYLNRINFKSSRYLLGFFYLNAIFIFILNLVDLLLGTNLFLYSLSPKLNFPWVEDAYGFYHLHLINEIIIPLWAFIEMLMGLRIMTGIKKSQLRILLISGMIGFVGGNSVVPLIYDIGIPPILVFFVPLHAFTMAYAIFGLRLMDIRTIIFRSVAFGFILLLITSIFAVIATLISTLFAELAGVQSNILAGLVIAVLVTVLYLPTRNLIERVTNTFLYKRAYDPDVLLAKIREVASSTLDLKHLLKSICDILETAFNCEKIKVALLETKRGRIPKLNIAYKKGFDAGVAEKLVSFPGMVRIMHKHLKEHPGIQVIDEMYTKYENGEYKPISVPLLQALHDTNIAVIVPLFTKERLIGLLVLGTKKSGDPYNNRDIQILNVISGIVAIATDNAQIYGHLEELVEERTEELHVVNEKLELANVQLKKLDAAKSEFISIASHQLRTPLTAIKGYISMMNEGDFGRIPEKIRKYLDIVFSSNERLITLVNDLLNISRIESGRQKYELKPTDLYELAQEIVTKMKPRADEKKLQLILQKPIKILPKVVCDSEKLHEVMLNFIDNAIKYTKQGSVTVMLKPEPEDMVTYLVKDTGMGISKENMQHLFKKFSRGEGTFLVHTEGLGLGLYVAKMIVEAHQGKIWAESEGDGKGSTFSFSIPITGPKSVVKK